jgi:multidrug efflux pump subunit AcrA (membrane-fusion protein)
MRAIKILLISSLLFSANLFAQEAETAPAPTNLDKLLELVKEGRTQEQSENDKREAEFKASRDKQNEILKAEQRELARQERIQRVGKDFNYIPLLGDRLPPLDYRN